MQIAPTASRAIRRSGPKIHHCSRIRYRLSTFHLPHMVCFQPYPGPLPQAWGRNRRWGQAPSSRTRLHQEVSNCPWPNRIKETLNPLSAGAECRSSYQYASDLVFRQLGISRKLVRPLLWSRRHHVAQHPEAPTSVPSATSLSQISATCWKSPIPMNVVALHLTVVLREGIFAPDC